MKRIEAGVKIDENTGDERGETREERREKRDERRVSIS